MGKAGCEAPGGCSASHVGDWELEPLLPPTPEPGREQALLPERETS